MKTSVVVFITVASVGCAFLMYFMYALWRDERRSQRGQRLEIHKLKPTSSQKRKLLQFYTFDEFHARHKRRRVL